MPRALSGRPEAEIGSGLAPALCVRCYRRKRDQGGAMGHNDKSLTGEVIPDRIAVIQAFLQAADPYLRFSRVSGSRGLVSVINHASSRASEGTLRPTSQL